MADDAFDEALPTFALLARFRLGPTTPTTVLLERLTAAELPCHEVDVERTEPDGSILVVVRLVEVSVDAHTAVTGLYETLAASGLDVDEVWVDRAVA